MEKTSIKRYFFGIFILFFACLVFSGSPVSAQDMTHTVKEGDTLWDICEHYYGDPDLWPKLWQMNPFVTNPHLLTPGDIIALWEKEAETDEPVIAEKAEEADLPEPEPVLTGINVDILTDLRTLGYLSDTETETWGKIFASDSGRILLDKGDKAYVFFETSTEVNVNDEFSVCRASDLIKHPVTGEETGYILSILGRLIIEEPSGLIFKENELVEKKNIFRAKITEIYKPIYTDSVVTSFSGTISPCVLPVSLDKFTLGNIVAARDERQLIGQHSVVYINLGFNDGLSRGNLFEAVKANVAKNPDQEDRKTIFDARGPVILPDIPIGKILILETRPGTSTGIVLEAKEELGIGTYVRNVFWKDTPEFLKSMDNCPIE